MRIYLIIAIIVALFGVFWAGVEITKQKCRAEHAETSVEYMMNTNKMANKIKRDTNEKTFNTSVGDIRRILRQKYTIAN